MKPVILWLLAVCVCLGDGAESRGVTAAPLERLTLDQAVNLAEKLDPGLAEGRALAEAAGGRARQAGTAPNPEAVARMESAPFRGRTAGEAEYVAGVAQPIPLGPRLSRAREAEGLEQERRLRETEVRRRELRKRVHDAFATALYQEEAWRRQSDLAAWAERAVSVARARVDAGDVEPAEAARAEIELARARVELGRSESMRQQSLVAVAAAMGDSTLPVRSLAGTLEAAWELPAVEAIAADLTVHPAMAAAEVERKVQAARLELARAERIPDVRVELLYRRLQASEENAFDVGVTVPIPLFDRNRGRLQEARAAAEAAEARARSVHNDLAVRLREAQGRLQTALATSRGLREQVLRPADVIVRSAERRHAAGDISLAELLPARRDRAMVELAYLESLREVMQAWAGVAAFLREAG